MRMSAVAALSVAEKAGLLEELLQAHGELRPEAEQRASRLLDNIDADAIAEQVAAALTGLDQELLNDRAGYQPGTGYIHETQAASDILGETLQPYYDDLERRHAHGAPETARRIGIGILRGLYACRDQDQDDTILAYAEDYPQNEAAWVAQRLTKLGIGLTPHDLALAPEWDLD
jgi:hypothetical protein